jgi:hypothetical protein
VRPRADEVLEARAALLALARRLRAPEPTAARGVAMVRLLLTDATSPLYQPAGQGTLGRQVRAAAAAMEPTDHGVVMP